MKIKLLTSLFFSVLLSISTIASHMAGGDISYKYLGNEKVEVSFKIYRDCRGGALTSPKFELQCVNSGKTQKLYPTLVSIKDISNVCRTWVNKCNPSNTSIKSSIPIFEEQLFKDTLEFNGNESDFKNCCQLKIGMGECCRGNGITTGGAGEDFWVTCSLDICKALDNSSPQFLMQPILIIYCNRPTYLSFAAKDNIDGDSLSFEWSEPLKNWTDKVGYNGSLKYNNPFSVYWPAGYSKAKGPNPNVNPPIGTYLDTEKGIISFTPTTCSEITKLAIIVKEWRKDIKGKFNQIGEIMRDIQVFVMITDNNPPTILAANSYILCQGVENNIDIVANDVTFIPPPPEKGIYDSTTITWDSGIKGATFKTVDESARLKLGRFTWTPPMDSSTKKIYNFTVKVSDNACPYYAITYKTIGITLKPNILVNHKLVKINDHIYIGNGGVDTSYKGSFAENWSVLDSNGKTYNIYYVGYLPFLYYKINSNGKDHTSDTIIFRKNGKYVLVHSIYTFNNCPKIFYDTIVIRNISLAVELSGGYSDVNVCERTITRFKAKVINGQKPFTYRWSVRGKVKIDTFGYFDYVAAKFDTIELKVTDALNNFNSTALRIYDLSKLVKFKTINDTFICLNSEVNLKARPLTTKEIINKWTWTRDGKIVSRTDSFRTKIPGIYIVLADSSTGCAAYDTIVISNFPNTKPKLKDDKYCQNKNELGQNEIFLSPSDLKVYTKMEWVVTKSLKDKLGILNPVENLIKDIDTSAGYDFKMVFGKGIVDLGTSKKDSLKFVLAATDSFKCQSKDTMTLAILKNPEIVAISNQTYCRNDDIDLAKKINSNLPLKIIAENQTGFDNWPLEGEIVNGIIKQKYFKADGGYYFLRLKANNEICEALDSINLTIYRNPEAIIEVQFLSDSLRFVDNSKYSTSRKWYLNNVFKTANKNLELTRAAAHLKPIRLELKNLNCGYDTTFSISTLSLITLRNNLIKIYPNPVSQSLTIETDILKTYQLKIFNAMGQMVLVKPLISSIETIDVNNLSQGVYNLEIVANEIISRVRFLKD